MLIASIKIYIIVFMLSNNNRNGCNKHNGSRNFFIFFFINGCNKHNGYTFYIISCVMDEISNTANKTLPIKERNG